MKCRILMNWWCLSRFHCESFPSPFMLMRSELTYPWCMRKTSVPESVLCTTLHRTQPHSFSGNVGLTGLLPLVCCFENSLLRCVNTEFCSHMSTREWTSICEETISRKMLVDARRSIMLLVSIGEWLRCDSCYRISKFVLSWCRIKIAWLSWIKDFKYQACEWQPSWYISWCRFVRSFKLKWKQIPGQGHEQSAQLS